jgi:glycyl-tRNA synthetase beta chain
MHINFARLLHLLERANAVQEFKTNPDFVKLVIGFKRVSNIIKDESEIYSIQQFALTEPAEQALFIALNALENQVDAALERMDYTCVLRHLVDMRPAIDRFFDDVLVNSEEVSLRNNRYALLQAIRQAFLKVADLSLLVVEGDKK